MNLNKALCLSFCMALLPWVARATSPTRYEILLNLHQEGPIEIGSLSNLHVDADAPLPFVCFSQKNQNLPVPLILNYRLFSSPKGEAAMIYNLSANSELLAGQDSASFEAVPSVIPTFNGLILAGAQVNGTKTWMHKLQASSFSQDLHVGLSYHPASKKHLLILFKINQNNKDQESCQLRHNIQAICIEAEPEI